jgi:hypothetical protein
MQMHKVSPAYQFSPNIDNNTDKYKIIKLVINRFIAAHFKGARGTLVENH